MRTETTDLIGTFFTDKQLEAKFGTKQQTWRAWRSRGGGPPFVKIGSRVLYSEAAVLEWIAARTFTSTATKAAAARSRSI